MRALSMVLLFAVVALGSVTGCATTEPSADGSLGELRIPLRQDLGNGTSYRLSALFSIEGDGFAGVVDGSGDTTSVDLELPVGAYRLRLIDGWLLQKSVNGGVLQPVDAQLGSPNPVDFNILTGGLTFTGFDFLVANPTGTGMVTIRFTVAIVQGRLRGTFNIQNATGVLAPYVGTAPSFTISYANAFPGVSTQPPAIDVLAFTNAVVFSDDPFGLFHAIAPTLSGGFFGYRVEVQPDGFQRFSLGYNNRDAGLPGRPINSLGIFTPALSPPVPLDGNGIPQDPAAVQATATGTFSLFASSVAPGDFMSGEVTLQFVP